MMASCNKYRALLPRLLARRPSPAATLRFRRGRLSSYELTFMLCDRREFGGYFILTAATCEADHQLGRVFARPPSSLVCRRRTRPVLLPLTRDQQRRLQTNTFHEAGTSKRLALRRSRTNARYNDSLP
jgi:hypothetical protein